MDQVWSARAEGFDGVGEALDRFGEALFEEARSFCGNSAKVRRDRGRRQHEYEGNYREEDSSDRGRNQHVVSIGDVKAEDVECDMFERFDVAQRGQREQGEED